ncbi:hypothetical protein C4J92_3511 [Pseudomonas sp. R3-18-08]|nr:hypothetical protein C4J92_3511 [Pseudomonas sp. R3-18-08]
MQNEELCCEEQTFSSMPLADPEDRGTRLNSYGWIE